MKTGFRVSMMSVKTAINQKKNEMNKIWHYLSKKEEQCGKDLTEVKDIVTTVIQDMERAIERIEKELEANG